MGGAYPEAPGYLSGPLDPPLPPSNPWVLGFLSPDTKKGVMGLMPVRK